MAYIRAIQSGNWSSASTWDGGVVPGLLDTANAGSFIVTIDVASVGILDSRNSEWVASGGTTLPAGHAGKFVMVAGSTLSVIEIKSSGYSTYTSGKTLEVTNGTLTVGTLSKLDYISNQSAGIRATPTVDLTLTITNPILVDAAIYSAGLLVVNGSNAGNLVFNIAGIGMLTGTVPSYQAVVSIVGTAQSTVLNLTGSVYGNAYSTGGTPTMEYSITSSLGNTIYLPQNVTPDISGYNIAIRIASAKNIFAPNGLILRGGGASNPHYQTLTIGTLTGTFAITGDAVFYDSVGMSIGAAGAGGTLTVSGDFIVDKTVTEGSSVQFIIHTSSFTVSGKLRYIGALSGTSVNTSGVFSISSASSNYTFVQGIVGTGQMRSRLFTITGSILMSSFTTGTIDFSGAVATNANYSTVLYSTTSGFITLTINGDVIPPLTGELSTVTSEGFISLQTSTHLSTSGPFVVTGTVYGRSYRKTIRLGSPTSTTVVQAPSFNIVVGYLSNGVRSGGFNATIESFFAPALINKIVQLDENSVFPVAGFFKLSNINTDPIDLGGEVGIITLHRIAGIVPDPNDVRFGVPVGATTGTYQLAGEYLASLQQLRTLALAVKAKSDQLTFEGSNLEANIPATGSILSTNVLAIKAKTDQLTFTGNGVVSDAEGSQVTVNVQPVLDAIATVHTDLVTVKENTNKLDYLQTAAQEEVDTLINNVTHRLLFDQPVGETPHDDITNTNWTLHGSATVVTSAAKFGIGGIIGGGGDASSYINTITTLSNAAFTMDMWVRQQGAGSETFSNGFWQVGTAANGEDGMVLYTMNGMFTLRVGLDMLSITPSLGINNVWHHIAVELIGGTLYLYVDGIRSITGISYSIPLNTAKDMRLGYALASMSDGIPIHIDEFRITTTVARYGTSTYTPPTTTCGKQLINRYKVRSSSETDVLAIKTKTDQLTFSIDGVVADAYGSEVTVDTTPLLDAIANVHTDVASTKTTVTGISTAVAGIKAKTDQFTFGVNGVNATTSGTEYTSRFNSLDAAVAAIPTLTYSSRFDSVDDDLAALVAGGGVDFTPVLTAIGGTNTLVNNVQSTVSYIHGKTSQLTFDLGGVVADVSVSVNNTINYDSRFDTIDGAVTAIKTKTDLLTYGANGVNATATVDISGISSATASAINPGIAALALQLSLHDVDITDQLTTIQNATGAIDLTPIVANIATVNSNVLDIPRLTYTTRFNALDAAIVSIQQDLDTGTGDNSAAVIAINKLRNIVLAS